MKLLCTFAILICFAKADYYWRDFDGHIPSDAVEGGTDVGGKATFIGQSFVPGKNLLLPATIYQGDRFAHLDFDSLDKTNKFTKILCSQNKDDLQWIRTNITNLHLMTECNQIIVGYNDGALIVLGRVNYQGLTYIGRVYDYKPNNWHQISFHDLNNKHNKFQEFEVLTYGCKKQFIRYDLSFVGVNSSPTVERP